MATGTALTPLDMSALKDWETADYPILEPTHVRETGFSGEVQDYYGTFVFDQFGNLVGGTLTGMTYTLNGVMQYTVTGLSHDALTVYSFLNSGYPQGLAAYLLNGDDLLNGSSGSDVLNGYTGNDTMFGGTGDDTVSGLDGSDFAQGNQGNDSIAGGLGNDELRGGQDNDVIRGGAGADFVQGALGIDVLRGGLGNDTVMAGQGNDTLFGGGDADYLDGKASGDMLTGGAAGDQFVFSNAPDGVNVDAIVDFEAGIDHIVLSASAFGSLGSLVGGALGAGNLVSGTSPTAQDADDHILQNTASHVLSYDADGSGPGTALAFATLTNGATLTEVDLFVSA